MNDVQSRQIAKRVLRKTHEMGDWSLHQHRQFLYDFRNMIGESSRGTEGIWTGGAADCPAGVMARAERSNLTRLKAAEMKADGLPNDLPQIRLEFYYDWLSRRVATVTKEKRVPAGQTQRPADWTTLETRHFWYDGWNLMAETAESGVTGSVAVTHRYAWGVDLGGSWETGMGNHGPGRSQTAAGGVGALLGVIAPNDKTYSATHDANGNVMGFIDMETGVLAARFDYDAFGALITDWSAPGHNAWEISRIRFSGKYQDPHTGWLYYGYRYLDAVNGRWPSRDPIGERGGVNLYGMVGNDAVNFIDPDGHQALAPALRPGLPYLNSPSFPSRGNRPGAAVDHPGHGSMHVPGQKGGNFPNQKLEILSRSRSSRSRIGACLALVSAAKTTNQNVNSYRALDKFRATGAAAVIVRRQNGGSPKDPPGYLAANAGPQRVHRGHLIPKAVGGSGTLENVIAQEGTHNQGRLNTLTTYPIRDHIESDSSFGVCVVMVPQFLAHRPAPYAVKVMIFKIGNKGSSDSYFTEILPFLFGDLSWENAPWKKAHPANLTPEWRNRYPLN